MLAIFRHSTHTHTQLVGAWHIYPAILPGGPQIPTKSMPMAAPIALTMASQPQRAWSNCLPPAVSERAKRHRQRTIQAFFWPNPAGGTANCQLANTWHVRRKTKVELIACQQGKPDGNSTMTMSSYDMNKLIVIKMTTPAAFNKLPDLTE